VYASIKNKNNKKILLIDTVAMFDEFIMEYGYPQNKFYIFDELVVKKYDRENYGKQYYIFIQIDWCKVATDYAGIEIIPFRLDRLPIRMPRDQEEYNQFMIDKDNKKELVNKIFKKFIDKYKLDSNKYLLNIWYDFWDVASGCIWNVKDTIKSIKPACHIYTENDNNK
jgi:hypothetical protein